MRAHRRRASFHSRRGPDVRHRHPRQRGGGEGRLMEWFAATSNAWLGPVWGPAFYETTASLTFIMAILIPLMLAVAYLTLWERKFIGWVQIRIGPNRVGPAGLLQPIADGIKLVFKEIILPANANKGLFLLAPVVMIMPALAARSE